MLWEGLDLQHKKKWGYNSINGALLTIIEVQHQYGI